MRLEQLQAFLAVVETGSFQKAAQKCGLTQSTISRQIQGLEAEVGLPLVHRSSQAKLTVGGDRFLPHARKICQEWQNALQEIAEIRDGRQPELCVAAVHSVCTHQLPPVLQRFCQDYPEVQLRITALGSDRALKVLKDGLVDVAIVMYNRFLSNTPDMVVQILYDELIKVLMAANHPLSHHETVSWKDLAQYPQVVYKDGYGMQRIVQEQFMRRGLALKTAMELNTPDAFRGMVRQGEMITLLAESELVEASSDPTLTIRSIAANSSHADPPLTRQIALITTSDRLQIPPIQHFFNLVSEMLTPQRNGI